MRLRLLDITMPDINGIEVAKRMRAEETRNVARAVARVTAALRQGELSEELNRPKSPRPK